MEPPVLISPWRLVTVYAIAIFYGFFAVIRLIISFVRSPSETMHSKEVHKLPDIALDPALGQHGSLSIKTSAGPISLHYVANGKKEAPLMLFLHGFPECWFSWRHQLKAFSKHYRVVAVDMRGYGSSDKPSGVENYALPVLAADVKNILVSLGYESCVLVAHDWGGAVAWAVASLYPNMIERLIIMNAPHGRAFKKQLGTVKQFLASWYMFLFQLPFLVEIMLKANDYALFDKLFGSLFTEEVKDVWRFYYCTWAARSRPLDYYRAMMRYEPLKLPKELISVPVLILWGTEDEALTIELARLSAECCRDATVQYIDGASHWVQQDSPEKVNQEMAKFLQVQL